MRLRVDLTSVTPARAAWLLGEFAPVVEGEIRRYAAVFLHGLDHDDLRSIAQVAVLEASLSHDPDLSTLKTWTVRIVRQRLAETVRRAQPDVELVDEVETLPNGRNPCEVLEAFETQMWVRRSIGQLDPRRRTIVVATMEGETLRQIGPTLGISKSRVGQERKAAYADIRQRALEDGVKDE